VADGLDPAAFGTFEREDGTLQTTYRGWPLYTYRRDTGEGVPQGSILGEGSRGLWFSASVTGYNVLVMNTEEGERYLSTGDGYTLYTHTADTIGNGSTSPSSQCTGECRATHPPLRYTTVKPAAAFVADDFAVFARGEGGGVQVAFRGQPLYYSANDLVPGDRNGVDEAGFNVAVLP
jgi:predicted lipoprotein with Yx(FWY)xxD motif